MSLNDFLIEKKLGDGAFSTVYSVKRLSDGERYALKKVKMGKLTEKEKFNALNEIRILASIDHPNVIAYKEAFFETKEGNLCIIMELADDGDLLQAIDQRKKTQRKYTEDQVWHFFIQVCRGLKALHDLKIVHRDIKCANLFLTKDGVVKLGDLNVSKVAKMGMLSTQTGTPYYASPEVWKDKPYDNRSDIWSLGCVVYEMITLLPPFRAQSMAGLATKVTKGQYESIPNKFSVDLSQMVRSLLQVEPRNRPTIDKVLSNPGLVRHLTQALSDMDQNSTLENQANLLKTIRCPRNFSDISSKLPASQYEKADTDRSDSQSFVSPDKKSVMTELREMRLMRLAKARTDKKLLPKAVLPIIQEDEPSKADEEEEHMRRERDQAKRNRSPPATDVKPKQKPKMELQPRVIVKKLVRRLESDNSEVIELRSKQRKDSESSTNAAKQLLARLNSIKAPGSRGNCSDSTDGTSTRVSSDKGASNSNRHVPPKAPKFTPQTPTAVLAQIGKHRNLVAAKQRHPHHHASIDISVQERCKNELLALPNQPVGQRMRSDPRVAIILKNEPQVGAESPRSYSRFSNGNKRNESVGMARAMHGHGYANRYEGVKEALAVARALSNEGYHISRGVRGPCPVDYRSERRHHEVSRSVQALPGLPAHAALAGYNSDRRYAGVEHKQMGNNSQLHGVNNRYGPQAPAIDNYLDRHQHNSQLAHMRYGQRANQPAYF